MSACKVHAALPSTQGRENEFLMKQTFLFSFLLARQVPRESESRCATGTRRSTTGTLRSILSSNRNPEVYNRDPVVYTLIQPEPGRLQPGPGGLYSRPTRTRRGAALVHTQLLSELVGLTPYLKINRIVAGSKELCVSVRTFTLVCACKYVYMQLWKRVCM
jgi:hypothetical protein